MYKVSTKELDAVNSGKYYSERVIDAAIRMAEEMGEFEAKVCLISLHAGRQTVESRMIISKFSCDLAKYYAGEHS